MPAFLDQIEIWFSLLQRHLLQPNHFSSLKELEQAILSFITRYNQTAKPLKWSYTAQQLEHKLAPRLRPEGKSVSAELGTNLRRAVLALCFRLKADFARSVARIS